MKRILSGMQPSGKLHLGNYFGALKNWVDLQDDFECFFFIADWHALSSLYEDPRLINSFSFEMAVDWLSAGLDPEKSTLFLQSKIPEHAELHLMLSMMVPVPWLERNPTYKEKQDEVKKVDMSTYGFLGYPVLQTADIVLYRADFVPVGIDQAPHLELSREIVRRFHNLYKKKVFIEPDSKISDIPKLNGLDGRKMSKSYGNVIPIFTDTNNLSKLIKRIKTNSLEPGQPKEPSNCNLFKILKAFGSSQEIEDMRRSYEEGLGWGKIKEVLIEIIDNRLRPFREEYHRIILDRHYLEITLKEGAEKAREVAAPVLRSVRGAVGIKGF